MKECRGQERHTLERDYICFKEGEKMGCSEVATGRIILPAIYDEIRLDGVYIGVCLGDKWGYVDKDGEIIFPIILDEITSFKYHFQENDVEGDKGESPTWSEAYAAVRYKQEWGFINHEGVYKIYIPIAKLKNQISEGWTIYDQGKWGIIDAALEITWQEPKKKYIIWHNKKIYFDQDGNITSERKLK